MGHYEALKIELQKFLKCYKNVNIYQFDFTVHYLPVYLALNQLDLKTIKYISHGGNDVKTVQEMLTKDNGFLEDSINIGLSEVYKCDDISCTHSTLSDIEYNQLLQKPIIERVPLWGISRQNNPKINAKQYDVSKEDISPYWNLFEGKFSLLKADDFKDLTISIYPKGSTIYRLFNEAIQVKDIKESGDKEGFDLLFKNEVDVCVTINPWYGISHSKDNHTKIEIVYNHLGKPHPFTSLYVKKYQEAGKKRENHILSAFLDYLALFIQGQVIRIYDAKEEEYKKWASDYCNLIKKYNLKGSCPLSVFSKHNITTKCESCYSSTIAAIQVLNDSRIYCHDIKEKKTSGDGITNLEREVLHCELLMFLETGKVTVDDDDFNRFFPYHAINGYKITDIEQYLFGYSDPILKLSELCNELDGVRHKRIKFNNYCPESSDKIDLWIFGLLCKYCDLENVGDAILENINNQFKVNVSWLNYIFDFASLSSNPLGDNIIYFSKQAFEDVFVDLRANKEDMGIGINGHPQPKVYFNLIHPYANTETYLFSIMLEFVPIKEFEVDRTDFVKKETNKLGHKILSGWYITHDLTTWKASHYFKRPTHGDISINANSELTYKDNEKSSPITLMSSLDTHKHYWCFIFKIVPYKKCEADDELGGG